MKESMNKTAGHILEGVIEGLLMSFISGAKKTAQDKAEEYLKAKFGNRGTNDEYLFASACVSATTNGLISKKNLIRVCRVIDSYPPGQRARIVGIIGKREKSSTEFKEKLDGSGNVIKDKKGNPVKEKIVTVSNASGAELLGLLGKMNDGEIRIFFASSGFSVTASSEFLQQVKNLSEKVQNSQFKSDFDSSARGKGFFERLCDDLGVKY